MFPWHDNAEYALIGTIFWALLSVLVFRKAGYTGWQSVLLFIPVVNIAVFVWFSLTEWPIQREIRLCKSRVDSGRREP
ncbi:MAG TPA: hypothetical protein VK445_09305 [Dissulfurispiraceae bacterium]|nr:hypothetical protein [Dissulfurispiraceae bacterium]